MALDMNDMKTAEIGFAAIEDVDKMNFVNYIKSIPSLEGRNSAIALLKGQVKDAETLLLQGGLIYRAIKLNIRNFKWER